ncbi:uncharacterized protein LOC118201649 [Stegodyphus dumicola]|uniref:uncharacterized protein LOC118201649 n=1 Tax=Stegodyphus dumicola TaxID=202533 RepID=UPI0015A81410|nr:uncharacterized protein LOC118201649 [Stegodyphus dumicola]
MELFKINLPVDILEDFAWHLLGFYHKVISKEFNIKKRKNVPVLKRALERSLLTLDKWRAVPVYNTAVERCAYVFKHSPLISSIAGHHLLQLFKQYPCKIDQLLRQGELKVCCLAGGPGTDAVAVSKIVTAVYQAFWFQSKQQLTLHITVIDNDENWNITTQNVMQVLEQTPQFFDAEKMRLSFQFLKADLTQPLKDNALLEICQADVLTMFYMMSSFSQKTSGLAKYRMIQRIFDSMKIGALLLFIDEPLSSHYKAMNVSAHMFQNVNEVYGPHERELHILPWDAIKRNIELYSKDLGLSMCSYSCTCTVSAWCKESQPIPAASKPAQRRLSESDANQRKLDKQEKVTARMRLSSERQDVHQARMQKRNRTVSLNAEKLKALDCKVQKMFGDYMDCNVEESKHKVEDDFENGAYFLTKPKIKRIFLQPLIDTPSKQKRKKSKDSTYEEF